ncbi:MAG TPA: LysR substrate-binding domain-containing protein [Allosphingosinicella sp.]
MKLTHIRDVLAVAEFGSLRAAGRHLGIAQPAVTRSIHEIERELGVSLFERHARGVRTTAVGKAFLRRAEAVQCELRRATEEIEQLKGLSTGQVSIAMSSASSIALLPSVLLAFRKKYPDSVLKISESLFQGVESEVQDGEIDFYVGPLDPTISTTHFSVEKLFDNSRVVAARKGHPLEGARNLRDLVDAEWVRATLSARSELSHGIDDDVDRLFEDQGLRPPKIVMQARSALATLLAVANSDLLAILPQQWLEFPMTADRLIGLHLFEPLPAAPVCIVRRHDMPLTPMAEHLCDLVRRSGLHYSDRRKARSAA